MSETLNNRASLLRALKQVKEVYIQPRFGLNEVWLRITKKEAMLMISSTLGTKNNPISPEEHEMYTHTFGTVLNKCLYLG